MTGKTLYQWFAASAGRFPDHVALEVGGAELSYQDLLRSSDALAARIVAEHGKVPARVGLLASRSAVAFAGYLAALRLGSVVVPVNPGFPVRRNGMVRDIAQFDVLLVDSAGAPQLTAGLGEGVPTVLALTDAEVLDGVSPGDLPDYDVSLDDVAYILFTSGSTGTPKGVPIRHGNLSPYVAHNIARYGIEPGCRVSHTFDLTFDPSVFDLFVTWGGGGTLVSPERAELLTPVDYLVNRGITHWFSVPSVVSVSADLGNLPTGLVTSLRQSIFIGEQLTYRQALAWHSIAPDAVIDNVYGPTELTVACTDYRLPSDPAQWPVTSNETVPIGPIYPFLEYVILDENGAEASEGELCVRGSQRFAGYLDPADNAGRFVGEFGPDAYYRTGDRVRFESGELVHLGRLDHQIKIRGYRVELGEIEAAMMRHPDVSHAVVTAVKVNDDVELVGWYTGNPLVHKDLIRGMRGQLPIHMVPRTLRHLDAFPLNANGKVDRNQLRERADVSSA